MATETLVGYDRAKELKDFDETKAGVKGLVDAGIVNIPKMFIRPAEELAEELNNPNQKNTQVPTIDLSNIHEGNGRKKIVDQVRVASEEWGFFQVINHGIPLSVLDEMIDGVKKFNEQDLELKKEVYSRDPEKKVKFSSNFDLHKLKTVEWRDTLIISSLDSNFDTNAIPEVCRKAAIEYVKNIKKLGETLFELLSEALGLQPDHLGSMGCNEKLTVACHYYPACPQPELALGVRKHSDPGLLTLLLQNDISGLQVLYEDQWVDVLPIRGAVVVNIGDHLQILSNDKFKSVKHRALATPIGPRISIPCFYSSRTNLPGHPLAAGPIKELVSETNPALYRTVPLSEYVDQYLATSTDPKPIVDYFKV